MALNIAAVGCVHGRLDAVYAALLQHMEDTQTSIDLVLCCGDFQCSRNTADFGCMTLPKKYAEWGDFRDYASGRKCAPLQTVFIHGNHEAVNYLKELYFGGWVAPNIYYLGYSGVLDFGGIRIAGLSGIFKPYSYAKGHYEGPPYSSSSLHSAYHVRSFEVYKLGQLAGRPIDVFLSHDWPRGIANRGNLADLLARKPFLRQDIADNKLGNPAAARLMATLQPAHWFASHMHVGFRADVKHPSGRETRFCALNKCLPNRDFMTVVSFQTQGCYERGSDWPMLAHDRQWIEILRRTMGLYPRDPRALYNSFPPLPEPCAADGLDADLDLRVGRGNAAVQDDPVGGEDQVRGPFDHPQTRAFMQRFGLDPACFVPGDRHAAERKNPEEIAMGGDVWGQD